MQDIHEEFIDTLEHPLYHKVYNITVNKWVGTTIDGRDQLLQLGTVKVHQIIRSQTVVPLLNLLNQQTVTLSHRILIQKHQTLPLQYREETIIPL